MCGIFGYLGKREPAEILLAGLQRLEYRGYDSWGIIYRENRANNYWFNKDTGLIPLDVAAANLKQYQSSLDQANQVQSDPNYAGIAHTRWATHGGVTKLNAHPHLSSDKSFALAQNGIVENYQDLKQKMIAAGHKFETQTDTEVIVRLVEQELSLQGDTSERGLLQATIRAFRQLAGRNTIILLSLIPQQRAIIAIRNGSPLVIGRAGQEYFLGSDYLSFANYTNEVGQLSDNQGVIITDEGVKTFPVGSATDAEELRLDNMDFEPVEVSDNKVDKGEYEDFMLKEIHEQTQTILSATSYTLEELEPVMQAMRAARKVYTLGCGTAALAAGEIAFFLRKFAGIDAVELKGYELESYTEQFRSNDIMLAISQSGETADTIAAVELMQRTGGKVASLVNMLGSTLTRISDFPYFSRTGPEICVASTKAFTAQLAWGYLLASSLGSASNYQAAKQELKATADALSALLKDQKLLDKIREVVKLLKKSEHGFILGRGQNYYIALEGALKIKEISYKHLEGFTAGELKHGVIALIEEGTPVLGIVANDNSTHDMLSALSEVKARGAKVIAIAPEANDIYDIHLQVSDLSHTGPIINVLSFQLIAYYLGKELGNNVDRPRNLAKSVTVK